MTNSITIRIAQDGDGEAWEQFRQSFLDAGHFFAWEWREVISRSFSHQPYYLIAEIGRIVGIMPLFYLRNPLFGNSLISVPYINGGGPLSESGEVERALVEKAKEITLELDGKYLELRCRKRLNFEHNLPVREHKVRMCLALEKDAESQFSKFPAKLRSQIRRPTKAGASAIVSAGASAEGKLVKDFFDVFSKNMRDLGTPAYPAKLFSNAARLFSSNSNLVIVYADSQPVAAGFLISSGNKIEIPWASSLRSHNNISANMLLYWTAIKDCCEKRLTHFDFGRSSRDSGTFRFKQQWGAKPESLPWYYFLNGADMPDVNPNNKKFQLAVAVWRRLPLPLANLVGSKLTRFLP